MQKFISSIQRDKNYSFTVMAIFCVVFLWFVIQVLYPATSGLVSIGVRLVALPAFLLYWFIGAVWLASILKRGIEFSDHWSLFFGLFLMFYLVSFTLAFWIIFYKITVMLAVVGLAVLILVISFLTKRITGHWSPVTGGPLAMEKDDSLSGTNYQLSIINYQFHFKRWMWIILGISSLVSIGILFLARTGDYIITPWSKVSPVYLYLYILISFIVFLLIFSQHKLGTILLIVILHSFLLHSYLPIVYKTGFGGDKWRHIAAERWLQDGRVYSPSLFGEDELPVKKIGPLSVPEVFIVGNKTSYANQWGLTLFLSWVLNVDVFWIDLLLVFIIWSICLPLFLVKLGSFLLRDKRFLGLAAFLPALFYSLQVYGAITIPVAFGFLYFVFMLILWLEHLNQKILRHGFLVLLLILTGLMYFNYLLYFILILEIGALVLVLKKYIPTPSGSVSKKRVIYLTLLIIFFIILTPSLDKAVGLADFDVQGLLHFWELPVRFLEFFLGKLLAWSEFVPLPTFISQGNFIFMQVSERGLSAATLLTFISWQKYISVLLWFLIIYGATRLVKTKPRIWAGVLVGFPLILLLNHFASMYYMSGVRLLTKRLDLVTDFFLVPLLALGAYKLVAGDSKILNYKAKVMSLGLLLAVSSGVAYASGPKLEVVTEDELDAAEYVVEEIKKLDSRQARVLPKIEKLRDTNSNYCVLANTWPLLGLEAVSSRRIVAGGFPVYTEYAQPERVQLWKKMMSDPSIRYIEKSMAVTGADHCYLLVEKKWLGEQDKVRDEKLNRLGEMFGGARQFGEVYVFYYGHK